MCVRLVNIVIIGNALAALVYFFFWDTIMEQMPEEVLDQMPDVNVTIMGALVVLNLIFAILLLKWKKIGFWGSLATTVLSIALNISSGMDANQAVSGLLGIILLYGILQIPYNGISAWKHLE